MPTPKASETALPSFADVVAAARRIAGIALRTPLIRLPIELPNGHELYVKPESLQRTGSFKLRGALNFLAGLDPEVRKRGVVAHSSGNHAQGVAAAARHFGVAATIVIPEGAAEVKVRGTLALGAEVVRCANTQEGREGTAKEIARRTGATMVPPYDDPFIVAGQGTIGLEIAADLPEVANVLVPVGGGGLSSGVALALSERAPAAQVIGVEPEVAGDARDSLRQGSVQSWPAQSVTSTMADGVRTQSIGAINFTLLSRHAGGVVTVTESAIAEATRWYLTTGHLVVEPTGALSLAALRRLLAEGSVDDITLKPGPTVLIISGGNIDTSLITRLLSA